MQLWNSNSSSWVYKVWQIWDGFPLTVFNCALTALLLPQFSGGACGVLVAEKAKKVADTSPPQSCQMSQMSRKKSFWAFSLVEPVWQKRPKGTWHPPLANASQCYTPIQCCQKKSVKCENVVSFQYFPQQISGYFMVLCNTYMTKVWPWGAEQRKWGAEGSPNT